MCPGEKRMIDQIKNNKQKPYNDLCKDSANI